MIMILVWFSYLETLNMTFTFIAPYSLDERLLTPLNAMIWHKFVTYYDTCMIFLPWNIE